MRTILARLTIFWGVFPSAISRCSCRRAFRSSTNRDSLGSIPEVNHRRTRDSNVCDKTIDCEVAVLVHFHPAAVAARIAVYRVRDEIVLGVVHMRLGLIPLPSVNSTPAASRAD